MQSRGLAISALAVAFAAASTACATKPSPAPIAANSARASSPSAVPAATHPRDATPRLTPDVVLATIRDRYISGVERCYSRHAKALGSTNGRVVVSFTVDEQGKTRDGDARGITKRVDGCIRAQVARWTFPAPREESAFSLGLQLSID